MRRLVCLVLGHDWALAVHLIAVPAPYGFDSFGGSRWTVRRTWVGLYQCERCRVVRR